jgi:hypothetical protein
MFWSERRFCRSFDVEEGFWFDTTLLSARAGCRPRDLRNSLLAWAVNPDLRHRVKIRDAGFERRYRRDQRDRPLL